MHTTGSWKVLFDKSYRGVTTFTIEKTRGLIRVTMTEYTIRPDFALLRKLQPVKTITGIVVAQQPWFVTAAKEALTSWDSKFVMDTLADSKIKGCLAKALSNHIDTWWSIKLSNREFKTPLIYYIKDHEILELIKIFEEF